jgi:hypothetical protein
MIRALPALALLALQEPARHPFHLDGRSLYFWGPGKADDPGRTHAELLEFAGRKGISRIYFMFPPADGKLAPLRDFLTAASPRVQIHALHPGDLADWLDAFPDRFNHDEILKWVDTVLKFNEGGGARFRGIHLDLEPHSREEWREHSVKLAAGYVELLHRVRAKIGTGLTFSAAVPDNWDREALAFDRGGRRRTLVEHATEALDYASVMAYRGRNAAKVLEAIEHEWKLRPGRVELIQETDPAAVEEGVPLHVGGCERLEEIFKAAREKFGPTLMLAVHHYATYRTMK